MEGGPPGWNESLGMEFPVAGAEGVTATLRVGDVHLAEDSLIHSGVYASVAEAAASYGAALRAAEDGRAAMGMSNHTSVFRRVTAGARLTAQATPEHFSAIEASWSVVIHEDGGGGDAVARVSVRLYVIDTPPRRGRSPG